MKLLLLFLSLGLITSSAAYADLMEDFDSLGGNKDLLETAKALKPESKIQIVQDRVVNRFKRHEFSSEFNHVAGGGNPYFDTNSGGVSYNFHFNPHWSLGAKYYYYFNQLTTEGADKISKGLSRNRNRAPDEVGEAFIPDLNWPKQMYMANLNWYPIYGKMNVFDRGIVHFDVYTILGVGEMELRYNSSSVYQGGLGLGVWWSQHITSRLELVYQTYEAEYFDQIQKVENTAVNFSVGYML